MTMVVRISDDTNKSSRLDGLSGFLTIFFLYIHHITTNIELSSVLCRNCSSNQSVICILKIINKME